MLLVIGALWFGMAALAGVVLAELLPVTHFPDGPPPKEPPVLWMIAGCAAIGAIETAHNVALPQMILLGVVIACLCALWCTDARSGIIPDVFTLGPLAAVLVVSVAQREWHLVVSAAVAFAPFALAAAITKGTGMGWGDVKVAALGGALLGWQTAIVVFALACAIAAATALLRGRRRIPIALGPYLAGAIIAGIPMGFLR